MSNKKPMPNPAPEEQDGAEQQAAPQQGGGLLAGDDEGAEDKPDSESSEGEQPGARKATPEQQAQYARFVSNGYHLIYAGGKVQPAVLKGLSSGDPVRALALTAVTIVVRLAQSAKEKGVDLDGVALLKGGQALYEELADLADKAKIHHYEQVEIDRGWVLAMHLAQQKMQALGLIDPREFAREVQEMNQAQADGKLDTEFPALGKVVKEIGPLPEKGQQQPQQQQQQDAAPPEDQGGGGLM